KLRGLRSNRAPSGLCFRGPILTFDVTRGCLIRLQENYLQPLVAVQLLLTKEDYNKELSVECRVEGCSLRNNDERDKFLGRVTFRIKVVE
uniref:Uncharacterized protein n=1 Tax=Nothobranchius furzeri TaxID=105023 RepID=A0A8C6MFD3_NOTFU